MDTAFRCIWHNLRDSWIVTAVVTLSLLAGDRLYALPHDGEITAGLATISTPSASAMRIEQKSSHTIINWNSFGIGRDEAVTIAQPDTQSILLNRVSGNDPSEIFGALTANGRIFLVNPTGILFAPGASINVGGLVASTLAITDSDFLSKKYAFFRNGTTGSLINQGNLNGGFIALLGNSVITNSGSIVTTRGTSAIAAGESITLNVDPCGLVAIKVEEESYNAQIKNSGVIEADDGTVVITAPAADMLLASVVNNSGKIRSASMTERDGSIVIESGIIINTGNLTASDINARVNNIIDAGTWNASSSSRGGHIQIDATGTIVQTSASCMTADGNEGGKIHFNAGEALDLSGTLSANGSTGQGGLITITAPQTLLAGSQIMAEGQKGGGSILIGGEWQGRESNLINAVTTTVTKSSKLNANAVESGNGGTVVLWSEQSTTFAGTIEAKGGLNSGNGGQVEVSSHANLTFSGDVVTSAPHGANGLLLLDPRNITIDANTVVPLFTLIPLTDANPVEGDQHGSGNIIELSNGNILVASPYDDFVATDAGAVRLYKPDGTLLSMLCGSSANDMVGETVSALTGNNHAVTSTRKWSNAGQANVGAITWIDGITGVSGLVSETNSLVGSTANDGNASRVINLSNANYVVSSPYWDNGAATDAGAVTWGNGLGGTVGIISSANSLTGSSKNDQVGTVTALQNGNYVISSLSWDKGTVTNVGAVTWVNGKSGNVGSISAANSLVGTKSGDQVGSVTALSNGNYVVSAPGWDNGTLTNAGMATLINGLTGAVGTINAANSLVGSKKEDKVGVEVTALSNDNYVVVSSSWDNGTTVDAGAVTWGSGVSGAVGTISEANSLVGSVTGDLVSAHVTPLTKGNFVVNSPGWDNGSVTDAGAVTWGSGMGGTVGTISAANSLIGSTTKDALASTVTALSNGHFVVASPRWDNGLAVDVGAVTWGNGLGGTVGTISTANSMVGSTANDGSRLNITPLTNGNYVIGVPFWDNGSAINAGAVTWGNGVGGTSGFINAANSLVGSTKNDYAGSDDSGSNNIFALKNGNYVVSTTEWDKGTTTNAGAVTWGNGLGGTVGTISTANSMVGSKAGDHVGNVTALPSGSYVIASPLWNGTLTDVGSVTLLSGLGSTAEAISSSNSLQGSNKGDQLGIGGITPLTVGSMDGSFVVSSFTSSNKTGKVDILTPINVQESVQQEYSFDPGTDNTLNPGQITALLNAGNHLILKANNDITINSAIIANNPLGNGGDLELNAGKSILVNANITTDNGNLIMVANDIQANGVVESWRTAGNAEITMAPDTVIDAGSGNVTIELRDGTGKGNRESADITLRTITAGTISAVNDGPTVNSGITLASGALTASSTSGSSLILAGQDFINSSGSILSTNGTARWIVYSGNSDTTIKGGLTSDFRHYDASYSSYPPSNVSESGNGFIYNGIPNLHDPTFTLLTDAQNTGRKVLTGETIFNSFNRTISAISPSNTIQQQSVRRPEKKSEEIGFIAGNTIEVPEAAEAFFIFPLPGSLFSHSNPDAVISLEVQSVNGSSIPFWMSFDPKRKIITGNPPKEAKGVYRVELVAKDQFGDEARSFLLIKIV
jgi:filamentous hemagglutinin family protein